MIKSEEGTQGQSAGAGGYRVGTVQGEGAGGMVRERA